MAGASPPLPLSHRPAAVAGMFYPGEAGQCRRAAHALLHRDDANDNRDADFKGEAGVSRRGAWSGAVVPHAGWVCSGAIAGKSIATLAQSVPSPDVVVVFGAVHT